MPYIQTPDNIPGIRGLMNFRPDAALALAVRDASGSMDLALRLAPTPFTSA